MKLSLRPFFDPTYDNLQPTQKYSATSTTFGHANDLTKPRSGENISFIEKYKPQTSKDLFRNVNVIYSIKKWIKDKLENKHTFPFIVLVGDTGTGKTELLRICFLESDCSIIEYDEELRKNTYKNLKESVVLSSVEKLFWNTVQSAVIIDNFQNNMSISYRQDLIRTLKSGVITSPVIFVTNSHSNMTDVIRAKALILDFEKPQIPDFIKLGSKICRKEKIKISKSGLEHIIYSSKYDIRNFINTLCMIGRGCSDKKLTNKDVNHIVKKFKKDLTLDIHNTINMLIKQGDSGEKFNNRILFSSLYTSSVVQENYVDLGNKYGGSMDDISRMADFCCESDIIKNHMFSRQDWSSVDIVNSIGTLGPINIICELDKKNKNKKPFSIKIPPRVNNPNNKLSCYYHPLLDITYMIGNIIMGVDQLDDKQDVIKSKTLYFYQCMKNYDIDIDVAMKLFMISCNLKGILKKDSKRIASKIKKNWINIIRE